MWGNHIYRKKKNFKQVVLVIPESNNGMNNVLTQIIGEKLGNLEHFAKSWKKEDTDTTATCSAIKRVLLKVAPNLSANTSFLSTSTQLARCTLHWTRYISFQVCIISFFLNFSQRKQCKEKPNNTNWLANHFKYLQQRLDVKVLFRFDYGWSESQTVPQRNICDSGIAIQIFVTMVCFLFHRKHVHHTHKLYPLYNLNEP